MYPARQSHHTQDVCQIRRDLCTIHIHIYNTYIYIYISLIYVYSSSPFRHAATVASLDFRRVDADTLEPASSREFLCAASPAGVTGKLACSVAGSTALIAPYQRYVMTEIGIEP